MAGENILDFCGPQTPLGLNEHDALARGVVGCTDHVCISESKRKKAQYFHLRIDTV